MNPFRKLFAVCGLLVVSAPVCAATATTAINVSATVVPTCSVSADALNFGGAIPNPINSNVDAQSTVTTTCSSGAAYTIALSAGGGAGATFASRRMTSGPNTLLYSLYTDTGRSSVWGSGAAGSVLSNNAGTGAAQAIPVFGRIPTGQSVPTGTYSDTVTVTVTF